MTVTSSATYLTDSTVITGAVSQCSSQPVSSPAYSQNNESSQGISNTQSSNSQETSQDASIVELYQAEVNSNLRSSQDEGQPVAIPNTKSSQAINQRSDQTEDQQLTSPNQPSSQAASQASSNTESSQDSVDTESNQAVVNLRSIQAHGLPTRFPHHSHSSHSHRAPTQISSSRPSHFRPLPPILPLASDASRHLPNLPPRRAPLQPRPQIPTQTIPPGTDASTGVQTPQRFQLNLVYIRSLCRGPGRRFFIRALFAFVIAVALVIIGAIIAALQMIAQFITPLVIAAVMLLIVSVWYLFKAHRAQLGRSALTQRDIERNTVVCVIDIQNQQGSSCTPPPQYNDVIQQRPHREGHTHPRMLALPPPYGPSSSVVGYTPPVITISPPSYSTVSTLGVTCSESGHVGVTYSNTGAVSIPPSYEEATNMLGSTPTGGAVIANRSEHIPNVENVDQEYSNTQTNYDPAGIVNDGFVADDDTDSNIDSAPVNGRPIDEADVTVCFDSSQATRL